MRAGSETRRGVVLAGTVSGSRWRPTSGRGWGRGAVVHALCRIHWAVARGGVSCWLKEGGRRCPPWPKAVRGRRPPCPGRCNPVPRAREHGPPRTRADGEAVQAGAVSCTHAPAAVPSHGTSGRRVAAMAGGRLASGGTQQPLSRRRRRVVQRLQFLRPSWRMSCSLCTSPRRRRKCR